MGVGGCIHILWVNECGWRHIFHGCGWGNIFYGWVDGYILGGWCWVDVLYGCVGMSGNGWRCILDGWVWEMVNDGNETGYSFSYNPIYNSFFILLLGSRSTKHRVLEKSRLSQMWQFFFFFKSALKTTYKAVLVLNLRILISFYWAYIKYWAYSGK